MLLSRRGLVAGLLALPAVIRSPGLLMPIKPARPLWLGLDTGMVGPGSAVEFAWTMYGFDQFGREVCELVRVEEGRVLRGSLARQAFRSVSGIRAPDFEQLASLVGSFGA